MELIQEPGSESDQEAEKMRKKRELRNQLQKSKRDNGDNKHGGFRGI
jgi:hypothetical protein